MREKIERRLLGEMMMGDCCESPHAQDGLSCIDKVKLYFENTNKTILGEEYLGNGQFGFTFLDQNHSGAFTANINTDCNCTITNVQVSTLN